MMAYKEQYLRHCQELNNGYSRKDIKRHNIAMKELSKLFHEIKGEANKSILLELLEEGDDKTKSLVAAHCLGLNAYVKEAKRVLTQIAKNKEDRILAFDAKSTLEVWKQQGYLKF